MSDSFAQMARPLLTLAGVACTFFAPPWVPLVFIILLALRFRAWEGLFIGLLVDFLWLPEVSLRHPPFYTLAAILIVWALEPLRKEFLL